MKTKALLIVGGIMLAVAVVWLLSGALGPRTVVDAARAARRPMREFVDEQAITRLPETHLITMPFAARIEPIALVEGNEVRAGEVVARIVPGDLELNVREATAAVERIEAAIRENADTRVEETAYEQAIRFVESMASTVEAAAARMTSGEARYAFAERNLARIDRLFQTGARTEEERDKVMLARIEASVDYEQDRLVFAAMRSMEAATNLLPTMVRQFIDRKDLTEAVLEKQRSEAAVQLDAALRDRERGTMTSPVDGVVLAREDGNERFLPAGTVLLEIGRLEDLQVEADLLSLEVVAAQVDDEVEVYGPAVGLPPARGTVARIFPAGFTKVSSLGVEQQRVRVIIDFDPGDLQRLRAERNLGVGYRVRVRITTAAKEEALVIPRAALFRGADGTWQVFAVRDDRARLIRVEVGLLNDEEAEILVGIEEGELVVLAPDSDLSDGQRVSPEIRAAGAPPPR